MIVADAVEDREEKGGAFIDFMGGVETGAWRRAQDRPNITFPLRGNMIP